MRLYENLVSNLQIAITAYLPPNSCELIQTNNLFCFELAFR